MEQLKYISISQYAEIKGITKQAVYKQLNTKLKPFLQVVDNRKCIDISALSETEREKLVKVEQPVEQPIEQPLNNQVQLLLENQIEEKDKTIESLMRQIESLHKQNERLTELLHNSQYLLAAEKQLHYHMNRDRINPIKSFVWTILVYKKQNQ